MALYSWLDIFQNMEDPTLFEIIRHYLGPVKTPYHKPELIEKLDKFFSREDVINQTLEFISRKEAILLTHIAFGQRTSFFSLSDILSDTPPGDINRQLLNLEERLLIWQTRDKKIYRTTPLCLAAIDSGLVGPGVILGKEKPIRSADIVKSSECEILNDSFFIAILSFLVEEKSLLLKKNGFKKRGLKIIKERFPLLFQNNKGEEKVLILGYGLISGGLAHREDETLKADMEGWRKFEQMSYGERKKFMLVQLLACTRTPLSERIMLIRMILEGIPKNRIYQRKNLEHLLQIFSGKRISTVQRIVDILVLFNELIVEKDGSIRVLNSPENNIKNDSSAMNLSPVGDVTLHPSMRFSCDFALSAELVRFDVAPSFQIHKKRFLKALSFGMDTADLQKILYSSSQREPSENLRILMAEWAASYKALNLQYAVVLRVSEKYRSLLDESGVLKPYVLQECGNGLWLLNPKQACDWRKVLESIGFEHIPSLPNYRIKEEKRRSFAGGKVSCRKNDFNKPIPIFSMSWAAPRFQDYTKKLSWFKAQTNGRNFEANELQEFHERLLRKIILLSEQIRPGEWRYEAMEAKGLDYQGKIRLINATMNSRNEELLLALPKQKKFQEIRVKPEKIKREGTEHILLCKSLPEEENLRIKVRKVIYMRKIRLSLF